jgi:hypothetical protein
MFRQCTLIAARRSCRQITARSPSLACWSPQRRLSRRSTQPNPQRDQISRWWLRAMEWTPLPRAVPQISGCAIESTSTGQNSSSRCRWVVSGRRSVPLSRTSWIRCWTSESRATVRPGGICTRVLDLLRRDWRFGSARTAPSTPSNRTALLWPVLDRRSSGEAGCTCTGAMCADGSRTATARALMVWSWIRRGPVPDRPPWSESWRCGPA